jgi:hypothetical protein
MKSHSKVLYCTEQWLLMVNLSCLWRNYPNLPHGSTAKLELQVERPPFQFEIDATRKLLSIIPTIAVRLQMCLHAWKLHTQLLNGESSSINADPY